jgi:hypothetical protein
MVRGERRGRPFHVVSGNIHDAPLRGGPRLAGRRHDGVLGSNQDPAFVENIKTLRSRGQDWPRRILSDDGYFVVL